VVFQDASEWRGEEHRWRGARAASRNPSAADPNLGGKWGVPVPVWLWFLILGLAACVAGYKKLSERSALARRREQLRAPRLRNDPDVGANTELFDERQD
jgi:hypothetical protein